MSTTRVYTLPELDCPNCAMKLERQVSKIKGVLNAEVTFVNKRMTVEFEGEPLTEQVIRTVKKFESEINVRELTEEELSHAHKKHTEDHHHEDGCCGHDHHEHEACGCGHEHHHHEDGCCDHDHHEHEACGCGHEHHHHEDGCCGHDHHEYEACGCGHEHHHHEDGCCDHDHHEHEACGCGHEHHHHEDGCCGHDHCDQESHPEVKGKMKISLKGLDCAHCAAKIEKLVNEMEEVNGASVVFSTATMLVDPKSGTDTSSLLNKIRKEVNNVESGIDVSLIDSANKQPNEEKETFGSFFRKNYKLVIGVALFITGLLLSEFDLVGVIYVLSFLFIGGDVVINAVKNVLHGEWFDETFLMSVATIGAFILGEYTEGIAVMLFYQIGELFQGYAVNKSRKSISALTHIRADYAYVLRNNGFVRVDPDEVEIGDVIQVKPGERIPLDGILMEGTTSLDTNALTGESLPRDADPGDEILAGMVNLTGLIQMKVTKELSESTVSRILDLVENASSKKAPIERFITRFARVYTPIVVFSAIFVAIVPSLVLNMGPLDVWVYRALTFLVVSCPCALVISIPLGLFAGIGSASAQGILVKGGNYLEILKDVDTVVFDKTGTLTQGVFTVTKIVPVNMDENALLELTAYGEAHSSHPIARSIVNAYGKDVDLSRIADVKEISGFGVEVKIDGKTYLFGNIKLMNQYGIEVKPAEDVGTIVYAACEGAYIGCLVIADIVKENSAKAVADLKNVAVRQTVMLTGDNKETAEAVAAQLGIDKVYSQLLPQNKVEIVEELQSHMDEKKKLVFVGDGINDAPVLARADLGVAMGGLGSDAAIEAADIVLMKDDPTALSTAIRISRKTHGILIQNIVFSLGIKIGVLILTVFGLSNMWMGVFADVGVTLLAILNSMRALKISQ